MDWLVSEAQIVQAMRFFERTERAPQRHTLAPQVRELADLLGEMWFDKARQASIESHSPVALLLRQAGIIQPAQDQAEEPEEPEWLGKGTLQCAVLDAGGAVKREVSVKARLELSSGLVVLQGPAWLVLAGPNDQEHQEDLATLEFDPCSEPDPLTGERYTAFCYCDDTGKSLQMDPSSRTVQPQDCQGPAEPPAPGPG